MAGRYSVFKYTHTTNVTPMPAINKSPPHTQASEGNFNTKLTMLIIIKDFLVDGGAIRRFHLLNRMVYMI